MVPENVSTVHFDAALRQSATLARTRYPGEEKRIDRGLLLALNGHVTLLADGTATVTSGQNAEVTYHVRHGACECRDFIAAPDGRCKHRYAVCLVRKALTLPPPPEPKRWYATYYPPSGEWVEGIAELTPDGLLFIGENGEEPQYVSIHAIALGGEVALIAAQRLIDGESLGAKFGQPQLPQY